jgi:hypothetical protein
MAVLKAARINTEVAIKDKILLSMAFILMQK